MLVLMLMPSSMVQLGQTLHCSLFPQSFQEHHIKMLGLAFSTHRHALHSTHLIAYIKTLFFGNVALGKLLGQHVWGSSFESPAPHNNNNKKKQRWTLSCYSFSLLCAIPWSGCAVSSCFHASVGHFGFQILASCYKGSCHKQCNEKLCVYRSFQ